MRTWYHSFPLYHRLGAVVALSLLALYPASFSQAQSHYPPFIETAVIRASLQALQRNGSDLTQPMPSKHRVECDTRDIVRRVRDWAQSVGFDASDTYVLQGHGGLEKYAVDLIVIDVPDPDDIRQQALDIIEAVTCIDGAVYATWTGEIVR